MTFGPFPVINIFKSQKVDLVEQLECSVLLTVNTLKLILI